MTDKPVSLGVIIGTRGIFNPEYTGISRLEISKLLNSLNMGMFILPENETPNGAVETLSDAAKYGDYFRKHQDDIDGIIVLLPNFGDEIGIIETIKRSRLDVPVLVQASNDILSKVDVKGRRDAFCGKISVCNNLYHHNIPFTDTSSHTVDIDSSEFRTDVMNFAAVCRVVKGMRNLRIGAIGARPAAFQTVRYSEKMLDRAGISVVTADLSEIISAAEKLDSASEPVTRKIQEIKSYGRIPDKIAGENIIKQARLSVAIDTWMKINEVQASAIQCWDSLEYNYGTAACLSMSMMGESGRPSACEVDVTGAVSMYALRLASGNAPGFLDWNNNYEGKQHLCVCTHCSNYPRSFIGTEIEISNLDILGNTIGPEKCFGAIKGKAAAGDFTFFRVSTDDNLGRIKTYVGEGVFTDDPFEMDGGIAVCNIPEMRKLMTHIVRNGFEHHVAMVRGRVSGILEEAVTRYLKWDLYSHTAGAVITT